MKIYLLFQIKNITFWTVLLTWMSEYLSTLFQFCFWVLCLLFVTEFTSYSQWALFFSNTSFFLRFSSFQRNNSASKFWCIFLQVFYFKMIWIFCLYTLFPHQSHLNMVFVFIMCYALPIRLFFWAFHFPLVLFFQFYESDP